MSNHAQDEAIGRTYRQKTEHRKRLSFVDAELGETVALFRRAATQLEALLANERSELNSALSKLNVGHVLHLLAEREQLRRQIDRANDELKRLGVPL